MIKITNPANKGTLIFLITIIFICLYLFFVSANNTSEINTNSTTNVVGTGISNPIITLYSPAANYVSAPGTIIFNYSVNDSNIIKNCSLIIDNITTETRNNPLLETYYTFNSTFVEGTYTWKISCYNYANISGESETRSMTIGFEEEEEEEEHKRISSGFPPSAPSSAFKICWPEVNNETLDIYIGRKDLGVETIRFFYEGYAKNPCLIIEEIPVEEIASKTDYNLENSYKSFNVTTEVFNKTQIEDIEIVTSVSNPWLLLRDLKSLILNRNTDIQREGWEIYFADLISADLNYDYFESKIKGFSVFLITANLKIPQKCGNNVCESWLGETPKNCCSDCGCTDWFNKCSKNKCVKDWTWLILLLIILLAIFSAYKLHKHMRNKNKFS